MDKYAYLLIDIFTVLGPLALSPLAPANQKAFLKKIFPSILVIAAIFIIHDIVFTDLGVWGFNYFYLTGMNIFNLPVEEVLFFICIPFGSLFIHATVTVQKPKWKIADSFLNIFSYFYLLWWKNFFLYPKFFAIFFLILTYPRMLQVLKFDWHAKRI